MLGQRQRVTRAISLIMKRFRNTLKESARESIRNGVIKNAKYNIKTRSETKRLN